MRDERGQVTVLIIGFAAIVLMVVVVVIGASAAFLQRQSLDSLAEGAALQGADAGAHGVYEAGVGAGRLLQDERAVRAAVHAYLVEVRANRRYPGIRIAVIVDRAAQNVTVTLEAPLDMPLRLPGATEQPLVGASSTAAVNIGDGGP